MSAGIAGKRKERSAHQLQAKHDLTCWVRSARRAYRIGEHALQRFASRKVGVVSNERHGPLMNGIDEFLGVLADHAGR